MFAKKCITIKSLIMKKFYLIFAILFILIPFGYAQKEDADCQIISKTEIHDPENKSVFYETRCANGFMGIQTIKGKNIIPCKYKEIVCCNKNIFLTKDSNGLMSAYESNGTCFIPENRGYNHIRIWKTNFCFDMICKERVAYLVMKDSLIGLCNIKGEEIIPPEFSNISCFDINRTDNTVIKYPYFLVQKNGKFGLYLFSLNADCTIGKLSRIIEAKYPEIFWDNYLYGYFYKTNGVEYMVNDGYRFTSDYVLRKNAIAAKQAKDAQAAQNRAELINSVFRATSIILDVTTTISSPAFNNNIDAYPATTGISNDNNSSSSSSGPSNYEPIGTATGVKITESGSVSSISCPVEKWNGSGAPAALIDGEHYVLGRNTTSSCNGVSVSQYSYVCHVTHGSRILYTVFVNF